MTQRPQGAKEDRFHPENNQRSRVQSEVLDAARDEIRDFLLKSELVQECHVLIKRDKDNEYRLIVYLVPSAQFSEKKAYSQLKAILPEIAPFCVFVPVSSLPLTPIGQVDVDILDGIAVSEPALFPPWEEHLRSISGIEQIAVVEQSNRDVFPPLHLWDLLPGNEMGAFNHEGRNPEKIETPRPADLSGRVSGSIHSSKPAISFGGDLHVTSGVPITLSETIRRTADLWPENGIVYLYPDKTDVFQSYPELLQDAERVLGSLRRLNLQPGDKVIFQFNDNREFLTTLWGCILGGFVPVPVGVAPDYKKSNSAVNKLIESWRMLGRPVILTNSLLRPAVESLSALMGLDTFNVHAFDQLIAGEADHHWHESNPDDVALMLLTSGSTGKPKGVMLKHSNLLSRSYGSVQLNGFSEKDISLNWMPLDHVAGIVYFHLRDVAIGCKQIQAPTEMILQDPLTWLDLIDQFRATITFAPNFAFGLINDHADEIKHRSWDLSSMRFVLNGAEAIVTRTARKFLQLLIPHGFSPSSMYPVWGMSETSSGVTYSDAFSLDTTSDEDPFVEVGAPIPGFDMRIVDSDGQVVTEGVIGSLEARGSTIMKGYFQRPDLDEEVFTDDGWFRTGDLGFIKGGRLTITGRQKDVIIINSVNYYSHEIEGVVEQIDGIATSYTAACAVREPESDTDKLAIFFHSPFSEGEELIELIKEIRRSVVANVGISPHYTLPVDKETIPKTEIGKIQRAKLTESFQKGVFREAQKRVDLLMAGANTLPNWFFRPVWRPKQLSCKTRHAGPGLSLVFMGDTGLGETLAARLEKEGDSVVTVRVGGGFMKNSANSYTIQPGEKEHYHNLLSEIRAHFGQITRVFHLWTYGPHAGEPSNDIELEKRLDVGLYSLLYLIQALAKIQETEKTVPFLVVSSYSHKVLADDEISCEKAMLTGLIRTAPREIPWLDCRMIDLPLGQPEHHAAVIEEESLFLVRDIQVAFRDGQRFVWRLTPIAFDQNTNHKQPLKKGGMYILSGGLGGIGAEVAQILLKNYGARLLILGRTVLPIDDSNKSTTTEGSDQLQRVEVYKRLKELGGELRYEAVDICDLPELKRVVDRAKKYWKCELNGIIHLAGSFHEKSLIEESRESVSRILRPKLQGTWSLHQLIKDQPGSLFLSFASVNGLLGGGMVGAYAAANAFLDGFASYQRFNNGLESYCLSWSMWDEIGMSRGYLMKDLTRTRGFHIITAKQGVQSLLVCLHHRESQCIIGLDATNPDISKLLDSAPFALKKCTVCFSKRENHDSRGKLRAAVLTDRYGARCQCIFRAMDEIPRMADGSVDRDALSLFLEDRSKQGAKKTAPRSRIERIVAETWQEILGKEILDIHENFFDLGGSSLLMARVNAQLTKRLQRDLPMTHLFRYPTIADLAQYLGDDATKAPAVNTTEGRERGALRRKKMVRRRKTGISE